ncbi:MAG: MmcQ/YjbR family DNA-binding protein [Bacteroidota bacterium]
MIAFKTGGRIFATLNAQHHRCCLRLSEVDQSVFSLIDPKLIHPVPKAWGRYGWTLFYYEQLNEEIIRDALRCAFLNMAPVKWVRVMEG